MKLEKPIYVTQPSMPPLEEFNVFLQQIWENKIITNNGPFHQRFEMELADYLRVKYISLFTNATLALISALQCLRISGEVITTPFSFVATTHSLWWNNIKPVFVDIEPRYFTLDPEKVEAAISPQTTAIMPVHIYGNPCNIVKLKQIADTYGLKLIYDAAHAFGVNVDGKSILNYGHLSILSFHATKVFNTIEGGAIICPDAETKKRIDYLKNFGFADELTVIGSGINAKMNELQAAYGILQLKYINQNISKRKIIAKLYHQLLSSTQGIMLLEIMENITYNYPYYPIIIIESEFGFSRDQVYEYLKEENIFCRRYFYPLISEFSIYRGLESSKPSNLPIAHKISRQVLCLPIYSELPLEHVTTICEMILELKSSKFRT